MANKTERRFIGGQVRSEKRDGSDAAIIAGIGSAYSSEYDVGFFTEIFAPGAFSKSLKTSDARCLFNHDNNFVLGRQKPGTLRVSEGSEALVYECEPPDSPIARSIVESIKRGDVDGSSIGFYTIKDQWVDERDDSGKIVKTTRTVIEAELVDVGPVTFPANPDATSKVRSMFPDGMPAEVRTRADAATARGIAKRMEECQCSCMACLGGDCDECDMEGCSDAECYDCPMQDRTKPDSATNPLTKRAYGLDMTAECFLYVGKQDDPKTWKLPITSKDASPGVRCNYARHALARFNQVNIPDESAMGGKSVVWMDLCAACRELQIDIYAEENIGILSKLTLPQVADLTRDVVAEEAVRASEARQRQARALEIVTSL